MKREWTDHSLNIIIYKTFEISQSWSQAVKTTKKLAATSQMMTDIAEMSEQNLPVLKPSHQSYTVLANNYMYGLHQQN